MYKISIILPVYNVENYLERCLSSLLNQTIGFENLEIIFIDDLSEDNSYNLLNNFTKKYDNIKLFQTSSNSGSAGHPRNIGLENASADYIMFLDPDDVYFDDACEKLYFNVINCNADLVSGNYISITEGKVEKPINFKNYFGENSDYVEFNSIKECPQVLTMIPAFSTKIYKNSFLKSNNLKFFENVIAQDLYFVVQCLINAKKIVYLDIPINKYELRENDNKSKSVTATINKKHLLDYIFIYNHLYNLLDNFEKDYSWMASVHLFFSTIQLVKNTNKIDKLDYFYNSEKLYSEFIKHYTPKKEYNNLFNLITSHNYVAAIQLSELMYNRMYDKYNIFNLEEKEVMILFEDQNQIEEFLTKWADEIKELSCNFHFYLINLNINSEVKKNLNVEDDDYKNIKFINIFEYFYKKCKNNEIESLDGLNQEFKDNLLKISDNKIILHKENDFELIFDSITEFYQYFLINYCLNFYSKPFIINYADFDLKELSNSAYISEINENDKIIDVLNNAYMGYEENRLIKMNQADESINLINSYETTIDSQKENIIVQNNTLNDSKTEIDNLKVELINYQNFLTRLNKVINEKNQIIQEQEQLIYNLKNLIKLQSLISENRNKILKSNHKKDTINLF